MPAPKKKKKKVSPTVHKAGVDLRKGSSLAGLAENERRQIKDLKQKLSRAEESKAPTKKAAKKAPPRSIKRS